MYRKKRQPGPHFKMPGAPFSPTTGERAPLGRPQVKGTTLAIFQVVEDDTHDDYIECRGYEAEADPNFQFLHDPYEFPDTTPIHVAKPFAIRGTFPYQQGDLVVAARIRTKLGYNPGKAATSAGQPADLDEEIEALLDDANVAISWLDISTSGGLIRGVTDGAITKGSSGTVSRYLPGTTTDSGINDTCYNDYANVGSGKKVSYMRNGDKLYLIAAEC